MWREVERYGGLWWVVEGSEGSLLKDPCCSSLH